MTCVPQLMIATAFTPAWELISALRIGLWPTILAVLRSPTLLLQPKQLSQLLFYHVWLVFSESTNDNARSTKEGLIQGRVEGVVVDIGAGNGHTLDYLDPAKVDVYIAVEPSVSMHGKIRERAALRGFKQEQVMLIAAGIEDIPSLLRLGAPHLTHHSANTIISILTLCSIPSPAKTLKMFTDTFLAPGGTFLYYEHVANPDPEVLKWQKRWTPVWKWVFDGCRLDRPTGDYVEAVGGWETRDRWGKEGEEIDNLWWHEAGCFIKAR